MSGAIFRLAWREGMCNGNAFIGSSLVFSLVFLFCVDIKMWNYTLGIVGRGGHVPASAGPVGVDEGARFGQQLICVGSKVVSLGLR